MAHTSQLAASLAALVRRHRADGRRVGPSYVGETFGMPLASATEGTGLAFSSNPFQWPMFSGSTRMVEAGTRRLLAAGQG